MRIIIILFIRYSFGLRNNSRSFTNESPGPGSYALRNSFENMLNGKFGISLREDEEFLRQKKHNIPGPGSYAEKNSTIKHSAPKYGYLIIFNPNSV